jgi:2',3'-cyclic-nucleotide 2'-phosphodiesterase (5'-nucleotidase family)
MKRNFPSKLLLVTLLSILLVSCRVHYLVNDTQTVTNVFTIDSATVPIDDSVSLAIIAPYKSAIDSEMNEVLAYGERPLTKDLPEGLLNNFIADLVLIMSNTYYTQLGGQKIDLCLLNNGGLRTSLPKGEITTRNVFELMPFENKISVMKITGSNTLQLFNYVAHAGGMPIAGIKMGIKDDKAVNITVNMQALDTTKNYIVVTSDYLADGGDKMLFFKDPIERTDLTQKVRDAIIDYLRILTHDGKTVDAKLDNRVYYE